MTGTAYFHKLYALWREKITERIEKRWPKRPQPGREGVNFSHTLYCSPSALEYINIYFTTVLTFPLDDKYKMITSQSNHLQNCVVVRLNRRHAWRVLYSARGARAA